MPGLTWYVLLWSAVFGCPWLLARREHGHGRGRDLATLAVLMNLLAACASILVMPDGRRGAAVVLGGIFGLNLAAYFARPALVRRIMGLARSRPALIMMTLSAALVVPLGLIETLCRVLTDTHILKYHTGIETVWRSGHDDWRLATITGDEHREPDPVLLWRPVAYKPYNAQRFKGPLVKNPKPANVIRIMCFGDSLTDGPPKGGWPSWLKTSLDQHPPGGARRFEVINAGVAGYSSHQGLLRFLQEIDRYQPDLLLVSFGWNDAAEAIGQPDKTFQIPPWPIVMCQRGLIQYRTYLTLMYYSSGWRAQPPTTTARPVQSRVSIDDYLANLDRFRVEAAARKIPVAFLTRAHKLPPETLSQSASWRGSVPKYNAALVAWARLRNVPLFDVQREFETLPETMFSDECHLTTTGYQHMAEFIRDRLEVASGGGPGGSGQTLAWAKGPISGPGGAVREPVDQGESRISIVGPRENIRR